MSVPNDFERLVNLVRFGLGVQTDVPPLRDDEVAVWRLARDHKVATILSAGVLESGAEPGLVDEARYVWQLAALRAEYYIRRSDELAKRFGENGIRVAPLKGVALARGAYPKPGQRVFRDLDLLIRPADLGPAQRLLEEEGFVRLEPQGPLPRAVRVKGDPLAAAAAGIDAVSYQQGDLFLELHTSIVPPMLGKYPVEESLCDEDFLVHLLFHSTRHHFLYGLRHLVDVAVWCSAKKPDSGVVRRKLEETDLLYLAWPTWKLSSEVFPESVPEPPAVSNAVLRAYTDRIRKNLVAMPTLAISLSGSPLPFVLMQPDRIRKLFQVVSGSDVQAGYQLGEQAGGWRRVFWKLARPIGLIWRHAPVMGRWLRFSFAWRKP